VRLVRGHLQPEELVAALAREEFAPLQNLAHAVCDLDQQQVPGRMAEHVVDFLEAVDVDRERSKLVRFSCASATSKASRSLKAMRFGSRRDSAPHLETSGRPSRALTLC